MEDRRRIVVDDVDGAAGRPAAEQRRSRPLQNFDPPYAVQRMHETAELVAIRKSVGVNLRVQTADQEVIEIAERILSTGIDAARIVDGVPQCRNALFGQDLARNDLDAGRDIRKFGAGFAQSGYLLQWRAGIVVVRTVAVVGHARRRRRRLRRLVRMRGPSLRGCHRRRRLLRFRPQRRANPWGIDIHGRKRRGIFLCACRHGHGRQQGGTESACIMTGAP